jgi:hypothetical protein
VSRVKRYLEDQTDSVLDSVRLYGSAVIVEARESDRYGWGGGPYALLSRTLETLARQWLCGASRESSERLSAATLALSQSQTPERTVTVPPLQEADALSNWREALEDCVEEAVESLEDGWLSSYGLRLEWSTAGLLAVPDREERDSE